MQRQNTNRFHTSLFLVTNKTAERTNDTLLVNNDQRETEGVIERKREREREKESKRETDKVRDSDRKVDREMYTHKETCRD